MRIKEEKKTVYSIEDITPLQLAFIRDMINYNEEAVVEELKDRGFRTEEVLVDKSSSDMGSNRIVPDSIDNADLSEIMELINNVVTMHSE